MDKITNNLRTKRLAARVTPQEHAEITKFLAGDDSKYTVWEALATILNEMESQPKDQRLGIRINTAEREALETLAQAHGLKLSAVVAGLIRQGIADYMQSGEIPVR